MVAVIYFANFQNLCFSGESVSTEGSFLEIVQQEDGEFVLKRMDEEAPLVTIQFSEEVSAYLQGHEVEIAKAMIGAGVEMASARSKAAHAEREENETPSTVH